MEILLSFWFVVTSCSISEYGFEYYSDLSILPKYRVFPGYEEFLRFRSVSSYRDYFGSYPAYVDGSNPDGVYVMWLGGMWFYFPYQGWFRDKWLSSCRESR